VGADQIFVLILLVVCGGIVAAMAIDTHRKDRKRNDSQSSQ
jgi:hypothetical protein